MWRSAATKASNLRTISSSLLRHPPPKVPSSQTHSQYHRFFNENPVCQNPRLLFSHKYSTESWKLDPTDDESFSGVKRDLFGENGRLDSGRLDSAAGADIFGQDLNLNSRPFNSGAGDSVAYEGKQVAGENSEEAGAEEGRHQLDEKFQSLVSLLRTSEDLVSNLNEMYLNLNETLVLSVLRTAGIPGENLFGFFDWVAKSPSFMLTPPVLEALVRAIGGLNEKKFSFELWDLVKGIGEQDKSILSVDCLNELISMFSRLGKGEAAYEVFNKFGDFGCVANEDTYFCTIEALYKESLYEWTLIVVEKMIASGVVPDEKRIGSIIYWLCKWNKAKEAHSVYFFGKEKNKPLPVSVLNFLVKLLSRGDETVLLALNMLSDFSAKARKFGIEPFTTVMRALRRTNHVSEAKNLLLDMVEAGPSPDIDVFNVVIESLSMSGDIDGAKEIKALMESKGVMPDDRTYNLITSGYTKVGQMEDALEVLSEAKTKDCKLSHKTYYTLIRGYFKLNKPDKAVKLFHEMGEYGINANVNQYNKMIHALCNKALDWKAAQQLLDEMKRKGLHPKSETTAIINAVRGLEAEAQGMEEKKAPAIKA